MCYKPSVVPETDVMRVGSINILSTNPTMHSKFFTNDGDNTVLEKFRAVFEHNPHIAEFDALVGYFYASGYFHLQPHLDNITPIRILVGISIDRLAQQAQNMGLSLRFGASREQVTQDYQQKLIDEINQTEYDKKIENSILQFVADIAAEKIIIKAHPFRNLHAKIYIFRPKNFNAHTGGEVISGSSNLTQSGLGVGGDTTNYEFNVSLRDYGDIQFATDEFEKLWQEATEILPKQINEAKDQTYLRDDFTPYAIYIKFLIEYFGKEVEFDPESITKLPSGMLRLNYQLEAVRQGLDLLDKHRGFFLADVVGLGKTVIAIIIAREYFYRNNFPDYISRTLIICPPAVYLNWDETVKKFDLNNTDIITSGSLHKVVDDAKRYDLIIIDEAHNFRNDHTQGYAELQRICKSYCRNGGEKRVILVSATPLNNRPDDIKNQLLLFQDANNNTLDINIARFFIAAKKKYDELIKEQDDIDPQDSIDNLYAKIRNKVIEPLTVRRTRTDLMTTERYKKDLDKQGIRFPHISTPQNLLYELDAEINACYERSQAQILNTDNQGLHYTRYRLIEHLKPQHREKYPRAEFIVERLAAIMKTLLIKRLDSSFHAFHASLKRFVRASAAAIKMFENDRVFIAADFPIEEYILNGDEDGLIERLMRGRTDESDITTFAKADFVDGIAEALAVDHQKLEQLVNEWQVIIDNKPDPKLNKLKKKLPNILEKTRNPQQKLVIFSESADTTKYLANALQSDYRVLTIDAKNRKQNQDILRTNFDANSPKDDRTDDYDILISTEALAEGVNLHLANSLVNYDTPWNSTRLMQRIGRINRIGSTAESIYIYNFFPTEQVNDAIGLRHRAQMKLQAFHSALGEDSQIYSPDEKVQSFGLFDKNPQPDEEKTERQVYLNELHDLRDNDPDEYHRLKTLPLKIRTAVTDSKRAGETLCFLRDDHHNKFYRVDASIQIEELGFLEMAAVLKSHKDAPAQPIPATHHEQIRAAQTYFTNARQETIIQQQQTPMLTIQNRQALNYLKALLKIPSLQEVEKQMMEQAIEWIRMGRYQSLPRSVVKLAKKQSTVNEPITKQLEAVIKLLGAYVEDLTVAIPATPSPGTTGKAQIIISQSCIAESSS